MELPSPALLLSLQVAAFKALAALSRAGVPLTSLWPHQILTLTSANALEGKEAAMVQVCVECLGHSLSVPHPLPPPPFPGPSLPPPA